MSRTMQSTIETGFRIPGDSFNISRYLQIAQIYGCWHFQVHSQNPDELQEISKAVLEEFGFRAELSYYLEGKDDIASALLNQPDKFFQISAEFGTKFLVIPLSVFGNLELRGVSSFNIIESLTHEAEKNHMLLCLEATIGDDDETILSNAPASLAKFKEAHPSRFVLFSINIDDLAKGSRLASYTRSLRTSIATVHVYVDKPLLTDTSPKDDFAELVGHLYWLPFKQQPLVFTNPLEDLEEVYRQFFAIVEGCDYWYI